MKRLEEIEQYSDEWCQERFYRISASLIRRAVSCTGSYLQHNDGRPNDLTWGHSVERFVQYLLKDDFKKIGLVVHPRNQWICCSPDGYWLPENIPIEIKAKHNAGTSAIQQVISENYHQLQFTMYCCKSLKLLLIVYVKDFGFRVAIVIRDKPFIKKCLPKLEYTFFNHQLASFKPMHITHQSYLEFVSRGRFLRYNESILHDSSFSGKNSRILLFEETSIYSVFRINLPDEVLFQVDEIPKPKIKSFKIAAEKPPDQEYEWRVFSKFKRATKERKKTVKETEIDCTEDYKKIIETFLVQLSNDCSSQQLMFGSKFR